MAVSHAFSNAVADWTGTVTVFNSQGSSGTVAATDLVRPTNWNSAHNQFYTFTGNTVGNSTASGTNVVISGGSNITISGATGSLAIHGEGPATIQYYDNQVPGGTTLTQLGDMTFYVFPFTPVNEVFPGDMSLSTLMLDASGSVSTAATWTNRLSIGFYTSVNSTQLTLVFSASTSWGTNAGNMNINDSFGGLRWLSIHSSQFNNAPNFDDGKKYWIGLWHRTSNNAGSLTFNIGGNISLAPSSVRSGVMGQGSASNTTLGWMRFLGIYSVTFSSAMPNALAGSDINKNVAQVSFLPRIILNNVGSNVV